MALQDEHHGKSAFAEEALGCPGHTEPCEQPGPGTSVPVAAHGSTACGDDGRSLPGHTDRCWEARPGTAAAFTWQQRCSIGSELLSTSSHRRRMHSCRGQPSLWCPTECQRHRGMRRKAECHPQEMMPISVTPHSAPQQHRPLLCRPLPIFWPGRAGRVSLPVQGPRRALLPGMDP